MAIKTQRPEAQTALGTDHPFLASGRDGTSGTGSWLGGDFRDPRPARRAARSMQSPRKGFEESRVLRGRRVSDQRTFLPSVRFRGLVL